MFWFFEVPGGSHVWRPCVSIAGVALTQSAHYGNGLILTKCPLKSGCDAVRVVGILGAF